MGGGVMPVKIHKKPDGNFVVATPNGIKAKGTSYIKAIKQQRLLNAIDHGFKPKKRKGKVARP